MLLEENAQVPQDWGAIAEYLQTQGHRFDADFQPRQFGMGSANLNYLISMDGNKAVFRRPPSGPLPPGANDIAREYHVLSRLGDHFRYAPRGLIYCDDESVIGAPFCISEFRAGTAIGIDLPETIINIPKIGDKLSRILVGTLSQLHCVDITEAGLDDLGKAQGYLSRQVQGWFKRGSLVFDDGQLRKLAELRDWLAANTPADSPAALVHNDFKLDNMLIDLDSLELQGVVDWDMCTIGDPLLELAVLLMYWGEPDDCPFYAFQCRMPCRAEGWWSRRKVVEEYLDSTRYTAAEPQLKFYWILALYRNTVVYAQLNKLFDGNKPAAFTQEAFEQIGPMIDIGLDHALSLREKPLDW